MKPSEFALLMQRELNENTCAKGVWSAWRPTIPQAEKELDHHVEKLKTALKMRNQDGINEYAVDVANICMKIVEMAGGS